MIVRKKPGLVRGKNVTQLISIYYRKIIFLKLIMAITNITFPIIALTLVIISTLNIAAGKYQTSIIGDNYIIFSALVSSVVALINSFLSFFTIREKIINYSSIHYKLIIEKQRYQLNANKYINLKIKEERDKLFENQIFKIITGYEVKSQKNEKNINVKGS